MASEKEKKLQNIERKVDASKEILELMISHIYDNGEMTSESEEDDSRDILEEMSIEIEELSSQYAGEWTDPNRQGYIAAERYTITFHSNDGSNSTTTQSMKVGYPSTLRSNKFKWQYHKFLGWATTATGKVVYANRASYVQSEKKDFSLYAVWEELKYTVSFNANGGTGSMASVQFCVGKSEVLPTCTFKKTDYIFKGWATSSGSSTVKYTDKQKIVQTKQKNLSLYAVWELATVTITYNANGGTGSMAKKTVKAGTTVTLDACKFTRTDYEFKGWATSATGAVAYGNGVKITSLKTNLTLYAVWEKSLAVHPLPNAKAWDACSKASCWTNGNAKNRIMNILSPRMDNGTFESRYGWSKGRGVNCFHMFISNHEDGEYAGYSIYGGGAASGSISTSYTNTMGSRIKRIFNEGYGVILWMMADDDAGWNPIHLKNWEQYCKDIKKLGWFQYCSTVCIGLEINESVGSQSNIKSMVSTLKKYYAGKIGVHFGSSDHYSRASGTGIDIIFGQISPDRVSHSTIKDDIATGKKYASAFNMFEICRTEDRSNAQFALQNGAYGVGNW